MSSSQKSRQWYGLPITVFLIGLLSIFLLLWVERISNKLHTYELLIDAIMDTQIHAATYHLRLEEAISGIVSSEVKNGLADLDQALFLIDKTLVGGEFGSRRIAEPLRAPELRARAEAIKSLLLKLKALGLERQQLADKSGSGSALEHEFHAVYKESLGKLRVLEDIIEKAEAASHKKSTLLFLVIMVSWSLIVVAATAGLWNREKQRRNAEGELLGANELLLLQAEELTGHRERLAGLVRERTTELTTANDRLRVELAERRQIEETLLKREKQIQQLSSRLINAQETERKRIAMELHDELGQALNVTKLRIRVIEKGLSEKQRATREECEGLLEYMNHVIEDVRRLSLALSPTILEDLGLTSALRWLVGNLATIQAARVTSDIAEIDHLFPSNQWITIYRVVQEALTNIGKHSQAENVSVVIRQNGQEVVFSFEDDGKGFDPVVASMRDPSGKGLGLATMTERMKMMGGVLDLWSREGEGTRINFSISVEKGGE